MTSLARHPEPPTLHPRGLKSATTRRTLWFCLTLTLALTFHDLGLGAEVRVTPLQVPPATAPGLVLLAPTATGVAFTNLLPYSRYLTNQILPNGSGVAAGDVDGDGWCDLYFCGLDSDNRLYRNLGQWRFEDFTAQAGVACPNLDATGAVFADLDGDDDLDLIVNSVGGGTHLFLNDGHARFTAVPPPLNPNRCGTSLGLADADGDGDLDLYLANYRVTTITDAPGTRFSVKMIDGQPTVSLIDGKPLTHPEWTNRFRFTFEMAGGRGRFGHEELGEPDVYLLNDGHGRFTPVPFTGGTFLDEAGQPLATPLYDWGLSVLFRDLNGDGQPDLYVSNDFGTPDRFWLNDGHGRFRPVPPLAVRQTSLSSMSAEAADFDRDGHDDLLVLDMLGRTHIERLTQRGILRPESARSSGLDERPQYSRNTLQWNRGDGTYAELAQYAGLDASGWSWTPLALDVDLDGYDDVLIPNGFVRDNLNVDVQNRIHAAKAGRRLSPAEELALRSFFPLLAATNLAFRNLGGLRFAECGQAWGFHLAAISQGACLADLDNDGDLDVVLNNLNHVASLYRNDSPAPRLAVRLHGRPPNTAAVGARIAVTGGPVPQSQEIVLGGRYVSSDQTQRTFAAGEAARPLTLEVRWRSGHLTLIPNARPNHLYTIHEPAVPAPPPNPAPARPIAHAWFEDVSERLQHRHVDATFEDWTRQPTLPRKLSQLGPGVAWCDLDADGWDDLVLGAGRGGQTAAFRNNRRGGFERLTTGPWGQMASHDQTGIAAWETGTLLVASANYEDGTTNLPAVSLWHARATHPVPLVPGQSSSTGPLAVADYTGDGRLDLFVGGRVVAARYPAPAQSSLHRQGQAGLALDTTNTTALADVGLVSAAVWTDLDADGWPELVLACDWGPIRVFRNRRGRLEAWNVPVRWSVPATHSNPLESLDRLTGWWNGVTSGDFDGDGALDLLVTNWGLNSRYEHYGPYPIRIAYADYDQDDVLELIEAGYDAPRQRFVPDRMLDFYQRAMPFLAERFATHQAWAETDLDRALGDRLPATRFAEAACRHSLVLLNRGDRFEARPLPLEAQLSPAFAACVADADGDGHEDVFLSQNFFGVEADTSRYDAGRGLWLRGDGQGQFEAVPGQISGVTVYGEQRGAALADFDGDGRVDLVVTQNNAETRLYRNARARPGLRVRLERADGRGPAIGAVARLRFGERLGPAREVHAGAGYWSQDSTVLVLAQPEPATHLQVRWPGGQVTETPVPPQAREVTAHPTPPPIPP